MVIKIGSIVTHPLFQGPGTVMMIHEDNGKKIAQVFWQSMLRDGFHTLDHLQLITTFFANYEEK
jgi:hypothetical protein